MTGIKKLESYENKLYEKYGKPDLLIGVSGLAGVGTTMVSKILSDEFSLKRISARDFFSKKSEERGVSLSKFIEIISNPEKETKIDVDLKWEKYTLKQAFKRKKLLVDGKVSGVLFFSIPSVRIWVKCKDKIVKKRTITREESFEKIKKRNRRDINRYKNKYEVDITNPVYYNIFIDNSHPLEYVREETIKKVKNEIENLKGG